jgi:hypothetical protein
MRVHEAKTQQDRAIALWREIKRVVANDAGIEAPWQSWEQDLIVATFMVAERIAETAGLGPATSTQMGRATSEGRLHAGRAA